MSAVSVAAFGGSPPAAQGLQQSMMNRGVGLGSFYPNPMPAQQAMAAAQGMPFGHAGALGDRRGFGRDMAIPGTMPGVGNRNAMLQQQMHNASPAQRQQIQSMASQMRNQAAQSQGMGGMMGAPPYMGSRMQNPLNAMFGAQQQAAQMGMRPGMDQLVGPMPFEGAPPQMAQPAPWGAPPQQAPVLNTAPPAGQAAMMGQATFRPKI